jgi:hypothetical protein
LLERFCLEWHDLALIEQTDLIKKARSPPGQPAEEASTTAPRALSAWPGYPGS